MFTNTLRCSSRLFLRRNKLNLVHRTYVEQLSSVKMEYDHFRGEQTGVAIITLNRPDKLNALTEECGKEFEQVVAKLNEWDGLRSVVIIGEGKAFSAGGDIRFLLERKEHTVEHNQTVMKQFYDRFLSLRSLKVPTIAAINGPAVGAGMCIAMACDMRVASISARMAVNFVKLGIHPGLAATYFLPKTVGPQTAAYLLLTGETITASKAKELGLVLEVYDEGVILLNTLNLARKIADNSPVAVRAITETLRGQTPDLENAILREALAQSQTYAADDMIEGLTAIKEKRPPKF